MLISVTLVIPALLHQATVSQGPHNAQREGHNDDEGQKELCDGKKKEL